MSASITVSRKEPASTDAVRAVSALSTGTVQIHPEHPFSTSKPLYWWLLASRRWTPPRPVTAYVIEHTQGLILFHTGQDRASVTDDGYFPAASPGSSTTGWPGSTSASRTRSSPNSARSGTARPTS